MENDQLIDDRLMVYHDLPLKRGWPPHRRKRRTDLEAAYTCQRKCTHIHTHLPTSEQCGVESRGTRILRTSGAQTSELQYRYIHLFDVCRCRYTCIDRHWEPVADRKCPGSSPAEAHDKLTLAVGQVVAFQLRKPGVAIMQPCSFCSQATKRSSSWMCLDVSTAWRSRCHLLSVDSLRLG